MPCEEISAPATQVSYSTRAEQLLVESTFKATTTFPAEYHIGLTKVGFMWYALEGSGPYGNGAASSINSTDYFHWSSNNVDNMGTNPTHTCAKASSTYTYTHFNGSISLYSDLKTAALYTSNTSTNTYGWVSQLCTSSLGFVCRIPRCAGLLLAASHCTSRSRSARLQHKRFVPASSLERRHLQDQLYLPSFAPSGISSTCGCHTV